MYPLIYYKIMINFIFKEHSFFYFKGIPLLNELHGQRG